MGQPMGESLANSSLSISNQASRRASCGLRSLMAMAEVEVAKRTNRAVRVAVIFIFFVFCRVFCVLVSQKVKL